MEQDLWSSIESKVRRLVKDIIEPTIRRAQESKDANEKLIKKDEVITERLSNLEISFAQNGQRIDNIGVYSGKIIEHEANLRNLDFKTSANFGKVDQTFQVVTLDVLNINQKISVLDNQIIHIEENARGLEQTIFSIKNNIETRIEQLTEQINKKIEEIQASARNSDSSIRQVNRKVESVSNDLSEASYLSKRAERMLFEHTENFFEVQKKITNVKKELQDSLEKLRNYMFGQNKDQNDSNKRLVKYIENDYKVSMNMSFIDQLYSIIQDPKSLYKLALNEKEKLQEWGGFTLQNSLKDSIERSKARCQAIIDAPIPEPKRRISNHSSRASLKKSFSKEGLRSLGTLKSSGTELKNEAHESEESEESKESKEIPEVIEKTSPVQEKNASLTNFNDPVFMNQYEEIEIIDYMPYIQELKEIMSDFRTEYTNEISSIYKNIQNTRTELNTQINETSLKQDHFIDTYTKKQKELDLLMSEAMHECNMVSNLRKRDLSDINTNISELDSKLNACSEQTFKFEEEFLSISRKINLLIELSKIGISLQQQDERDRDSISLMGYKETKIPGKASIKKPVVSIDKMCQSCTGQASIVLSAFKMACLAYAPSQVMYSKQFFSRKELIDMQKRIIEGVASNDANNSIIQIPEDKQNTRAKSAFTMRRFRPSSVPIGSNATNVEIYSSIGSDLPVLHKKL
jgi:hypothetical protein